jgi:PadR family transcriptional regulator PadR
VFEAKANKSVPGELLPGTLDMLILKTVSRAPQHGYAIAESIQRTSDDLLRVEEGALYPALHRLELRGHLAAEWGVSENNRRAKFYQLTPLGRRQLRHETKTWGLLVEAVGKVLKTREQPT